MSHSPVRPRAVPRLPGGLGHTHFGRRRMFSPLIQSTLSDEEFFAMSIPGQGRPIGIKMSTLREQIEYAWAGYGSTNWISFIPSDLIRSKISDYSRAYGQLWQVTLHYNNCKKPCNLSCAKSAANLVQSRINSINRGMPDLHPDIEQAVMSRAFEIHYAHGGTGVMSPSWVESGTTAPCNCFDKALKEMYPLGAPVQRIKLTDDDFWFQERFE